MAQDKKGVDTANKVSIKVLYPKHISNQLAHNDIPIFKNPVSHAKPFFLVKPAIIGHNSQQQVGILRPFATPFSAFLPH